MPCLLWVGDTWPGTTVAATHGSRRRSCPRSARSADGRHCSGTARGTLPRNTPAAGRAFEAIRPAGRDHHRATFLLGTVQRIEPGLTESLLELYLVASHCRAPPILYVHGLHHVLEAEESA